MRKATSLLLSFALVLPDMAAAATSQPIGATLEVVNVVTGEIESEKRTLATGDKVHRDESIEVAPDALSEIKLDDDTKLALGPGSKLKLDKFVYDPEQTTGSIVMKMAKGTFRFMTGVAKKPAYRITTPAASITVRGTIFDTYVELSGRTWVLLHEGAVEVCNLRGRCRQLDEPGRLIVVDDDGTVRQASRWSALQGRGAVPFDTAFPFVSKPPQIDPTPILSRDAILEDEAPTKRPKKAEKSEEKDTPKRTKAPREDGDTKPPAKKADTREDKKPKKEASQPPKVKPVKSSKADDEAIKKGLGVAIGVGIAIGGAKIGGGGGKHNGSSHGDGPRGGNKYPGGTKMPGGTKQGGLNKPQVKTGSGMSSMGKKGFSDYAK